MPFRCPSQPELLWAFYRNSTSLACMAATSQIHIPCYKTQGQWSLSESIPWVFVPLFHG